MPSCGVAVPVEDGEVAEGASEWLLCAGDSLEAAFADGSACGFDQFGEGADDVREELRETLCELHEALCADTDQIAVEKAGGGAS